MKTRALPAPARGTAPGLVETSASDFLITRDSSTLLNLSIKFLLQDTSFSDGFSIRNRLRERLQMLNVALVFLCDSFRGKYAHVPSSILQEVVKDGFLGGELKVKAKITRNLAECSKDIDVAYLFLTGAEQGNLAKILAIYSEKKDFFLIPVLMGEKAQCHFIGGDMRVFPHRDDIFKFLKISIGSFLQTMSGKIIRNGGASFLEMSVGFSRRESLIMANIKVNSFQKEIMGKEFNVEFKGFNLLTKINGAVVCTNDIEFNSGIWRNDVRDVEGGKSLMTFSCLSYDNLARGQGVPLGKLRSVKASTIKASVEMIINDHDIHLPGIEKILRPEVNLNKRIVMMSLIKAELRNLMKPNAALYEVEFDSKYLI